MTDASVRTTGFTYIENLVAITILAISATALSASALRTLRGAATALDRTRAVLLAWSAYETLQTLAGGRARNRLRSLKTMLPRRLRNRFILRLSRRTHNGIPADSILVRWRIAGSRNGRTDPVCTDPQRNPGAGHLGNSSFSTGCYRLENLLPGAQDAR